MQIIIDNLSKIVPFVLLLMAVLLFAFAFIGGAFGLHFDPGQLTTLTNLLYGLSGLGLGATGGALLATREARAAQARAEADFKIAMTIVQATEYLKSVLDRHGRVETAENQADAWKRNQPDAWPHP